mmetsp:Transcript_3758/g.7683  ORF Transcript_3758/g.7683 Transcript_3758/m.7683 type:complete len:82 (+) Transcript_3758:197-442(+)
MLLLFSETLSTPTKDARRQHQQQQQQQQQLQQQQQIRSPTNGAKDTAFPGSPVGSTATTVSIVRANDNDNQQLLLYIQSSL